MLERFRNRALLLKVEATEGVDALPVPATDAFQLFDGSSGLTGETVERMVDRPFFTHDPFVVTSSRGFVEGGFEMVPPTGAYTGVTKAAVDALLRVGGMAKTFVAGPPAVVRYNPVSTAIPSATAYFYHAGTYYKLVAARAAISELSMNIGSYLQGKLRIEGSCTQVEEAALPTGLDYSAFATPVANTTESMEMRINAVAVEGKDFSIDFGSTIQTVEHTEARLTRITDRKPTFRTRFYRPARAALDPFALWRAGTIVPVWGSVTDPVTGLQTKITARGQIEACNPVDIDGDLGYEVSGRCIASSVGGDEILIEFQDTTP
jgi:hypothetical protein